MNVPVIVAANRHRSRNSLRASLSIVCAALAIYAVAAIARWLAAMAFLSAWSGHPWLDQIVLKSVMGAAALFALRIEHMSLTEAGFVRPEPALSWKHLVVGVVVLNVAISAIMLRLPAASYIGALTPVQSIMIIGLFDPFVEELFLRGWFQASLARVCNRTELIICASALMFGLLHAFVYLRGVPGVTTCLLVASSSLLGFVVAIIRERYRSLIPAIVVHAVYNLTGIAVGLGVSFIIAHPRL